MLRGVCGSACIVREGFRGSDANVGAAREAVNNPTGIAWAAHGHRGAEAGRQLDRPLRAADLPVFPPIPPTASRLGTRCSTGYYGIERVRARCQASADPRVPVGGPKMERRKEASALVRACADCVPIRAKRTDLATRVARAISARCCPAVAFAAAVDGVCRNV